jgi:hypothetical protein
MKLDYNFRRALLLSISVFLLSYCIFNCWYEDYESQYDVAISGVSRLFILGDFSILINFQVYRVYEFLYGNIPFVPWRALIYAGISILCTTVFVYPVLSAKLKLQRKVMFLIILYTILFIPNYVFFNYTRISFFLVGAGWLLCSGFFVEKEKWNYILGIAMISIGSLIRIESSILACFISISTILFRTKSLKATIKFSVLPMITPTLYVVYILYNIAYTQKYYFMIEPDVEYAINIGQDAQIVPLSEMKTYTDSLRYKAATSWQVEDSVNVTPAFLRSLILKEKSYFRSFEAIKLDFLDRYFNYSGASFTAFLILILILNIVSFKKGRKNGFFFLLYSISHLFILLVPNLRIRTVARVNDPFIMVSICFMMFLFMPKEIKNLKYNPFLILTFYIVFIGLSLVSLDRLNEQAKILNKEYVSGKTILQQLDKKYRGYYMFAHDDMKLFKRPAFKTGYHSSHPILLSGIAQMTYVDESRRFIESFYPCDFYNYGCRFEYIKTLRPGVIVLAEEGHVLFYKEYLKTFYGVNFKLTRKFGIYDSTFVYELEK